MYNDEKLGVVTLKAPGEHNVKNALASIATGLELGIDFKLIKAGIESFQGVYRRFQLKYNNGIMVIDDYAHHPTEVQATLNAAHEGMARPKSSCRIPASFVFENPGAVQGIWALLF